MSFTRTGFPFNGQTASASAAISGSVVSVAVTNGGSGYLVNTPPAVTFTGGGGGTGAAAQRWSAAVSWHHGPR